MEAEPRSPASEWGSTRSRSLGIDTGTGTGNGVITRRGSKRTSSSRLASRRLTFMWGLRGRAGSDVNTSTATGGTADAEGSTVGDGGSRDGGLRLMNHERGAVHGGQALRLHIRRRSIHEEGAENLNQTDNEEEVNLTDDAAMIAAGIEGCAPPSSIRPGVVPGISRRLMIRRIRHGTGVTAMSSGNGDELSETIPNGTLANDTLGGSDITRDDGEGNIGNDRYPQRSMHRANHSRQTRTPIRWGGVILALSAACVVVVAAICTGVSSRYGGRSS